MPPSGCRRCGRRLHGYDPPARPANGNGLFARLLRRQETAEQHQSGLYLVGEVGRGKSMLMDLFFAAADVRRKQRIHFHRFMQTVHVRFHAFRRANPDIADPIPPLADFDRRGGGAAVLRRIPGERHRRRDDPRAGCSRRCSTAA